MSQRLLNFVNRLFNEYKFVRRVIVVWAIWLISLVALRATADMALVTASVAALAGSVIGILGVVLKFYFDDRNCDGKDQ